ncbi:hypothetical protein [Flavobacterium coralii]|uniref:hypothetical protein n=1 Tax=Flavobacterium coralii TaxID=2838017 RepID=UPI000C5AAF55|nr:hypothetical protein [Flavobacterium coralii]MBF00616.1 hypothetical protein [Flavobacterium sp.]MBY8963790.1 hypothetical protein [Flavobacterium coralii]|tara:strand:+ start:68509 stop:68784 length:276 start_codon:yes stop_codon:yes gene_type:complete
MNYKKFENELGDACRQVQTEFLKRFKQGVYISAGGANLENFINDLQQEYEKVASNFIKENGLENDIAARKRVLALAKQHAKKCIEEFSKIQ